MTTETPVSCENCCYSVDGFHSSDLTAYIALEPNSTMAALAKQGVIYPNAYLPGPSDSFPGILALTTGNNVSVTGVYYGEHSGTTCTSLVLLWRHGVM